MQLDPTIPALSFKGTSARTFLICSLLAFPSRGAPPVEPAFDLTATTRAPFPTDRFTVRDETQLTGRRVQLPKPDCSARPTDCENIDVINEADGFNIQPRISIPFTGAIDVASVSSATVFLVELGDAVSPKEHDGKNDGRRKGHRFARKIGVDRIVWDVQTKTLHVESAEQLDQHTRYLIVVTRAVRDASGKSILPSRAFAEFQREDEEASGEDRSLERYREALHDAIERADVQSDRIAVASVFTTMSVSATLEKLRDQVLAMPLPPPADFLLGPAGSDGQGTRTVFALNVGATCAGTVPRALCGLTFNQETSTTGPLVPVSLATQLGLLRLFPGKLGRVAFGRYKSPDYMVRPDSYIPSFGTRTGTPHPQTVEDIYFNLFLPAGSRPPGGWPVVIFMHGSSQHKNSVPFNVAASMAEHGLATIAISTARHGFGARGTLTAELTGGEKLTFPAGGRSIDQDGNGRIAVDEGSVPSAPRTVSRSRHLHQQTVVDLIQLVNVIEVGVDVDGDGIAELDASRIYYAGNSEGAGIGVVFSAVDRRVRAAVVTAPGAGPEFSRLSPPARPVVGQIFEARTPSLLNPPGLSSIGGIPVPPPRFDENLPLRGQPPVINEVAGAMAIQDQFERSEWMVQPGGAAAFAPFLRKAPLPGIPPRPIIVQLARGDQSVPNPATAALLRAGDLADRATLYRHDLFAGKAQFKNPHTFALVTATPVMKDIALAAQRQTAVFFASDGQQMIDPDDSGPLFEVPLAVGLAELETRLEFVP